MGPRDKLSHLLLKIKCKRAYREREYLRVIELCQEYLTGCPAYPPFLELLAKAYTNEQQYEAALEQWQRLQRLDPSNAGYHVQAARASYNLGQYDEAVAECAAALELNDTSVATRSLKARAHLKLGEHDEAEQLLEADLQAEGIRYGSLFFARLAYGLGRLVKAEQICQQLLNKHPDNVDAMELWSRILTRRSESEQAYGLWERLVKLKPRDLSLQMRFARAAYNLGHTQTSLEACEKVLEHKPDSLRALELKGRILHRQRNWPEALVVYRRLKELAPRNRQVWTLYLKLLHRMDHKEEAHQELVSLERSWRKSAQDLLNLALLNEELLNYSAARKLLVKALDLNHGKPQLILKAAQDYLALGRLEMVHHLMERSRQEEISSGGLRRFEFRFQRLLAELAIDPDGLVKAFGRLAPVHTYSMVVKAIMTRVQRFEGSDQGHIPGNGKTHLAIVSSTLNRGGAERQVILTLRGLQDEGSSIDRFTLFFNMGSTLQDPDLNFLEELKGTKVELKDLEWLDPALKKHIDIRKAVEPWNTLLQHLPINIRRRMENLFLEFSVNKPEVVHAWQDNINIIAGTAAVMAGVPRIILSARSLRPDQKTLLHAINTQHARACYLALLEHPGVSLCVNSQAAAQSYGDWLGIAPESIPVIYNGIDISALVATARKVDLRKIWQAMGIDKQTILVGGVFRLTEEKRPRLWVETAVRVLEARPEVHFILVGDGAMLDETRHLVGELDLGSRVHLVGHSRTIGAWLNRFDLFLYTSRIEGLPNTLIEAQAFGVPVVTTQAGGARETLVERQTGWVVEEAKPVVLAKRVLWCFDNKAWCAKASAISHQNIKTKFNLPVMIEHTLKLYRITFQKDAT